MYEDAKNFYLDIKGKKFSKLEYLERAGKKGKNIFDNQFAENKIKDVELFPGVMYLKLEKTRLDGTKVEGLLPIINFKDLEYSAKKHTLTVYYPETGKEKIGCKINLLFDET